MKNLLALLSLFILLCSCGKPDSYESSLLKIERLTESTFVHTSYLESEEFGKVSCNGMLVINKNEAIVYDTPSNNEASKELLNWIEKELECKVKTVVVSHFHIDCLGGLAAFHNNNIPSYANQNTIRFASAKGNIVPTIGIEKYFIHELGNEKVTSEFLGAGHSRDNIVGYFPSEEVLFGGCLIKAVGSGKGNLEDADTSKWSNTVQKIKDKYPNLKFVIPGHGKVGGVDLLDYTIEMFN